GAAQPAGRLRPGTRELDDGALSRRRGRGVRGARGDDRVAALVRASFLKPAQARQVEIRKKEAAIAKTDYKIADDYLAAFDAGARKILETVRKTIRAAVPGAEPTPAP